MKELHAKPVTNAAVFMATAFALMAVLTIPTLAQQGGQVYVPPVIQSRDTEVTRQRSTKLLRDLRDRDRPTNQRHIQVTLAQVNQDLTRIQVLRNEIVRAVLAANALDYKRISD